MIRSDRPWKTPNSSAIPPCGRDLQPVPQRALRVDEDPRRRHHLVRRTSHCSARHRVRRPRAGRGGRGTRRPARRSPPGPPRPARPRPAGAPARPSAGRPAPGHAPAAVPDAVGHSHGPSSASSGAPARTARPEPPPAYSVPNNLAQVSRLVSSGSRRWYSARTPRPSRATARGPGHPRGQPEHQLAVEAAHPHPVLGRVGDDRGLEQRDVPPVGVRVGIAAVPRRLPSSCQTIRLTSTDRRHRRRAGAAST